MTEQVSSMKHTKFHPTLAVAAMAALTAVLASCGGGGDDEAGSPTAFGVQPKDYSLTTPRCVGGYMGEVAIVGGTAPYRMINTFPDLVLMHRSMTDLTPVSTVQDRNGTFSVTFTGGCFDPGTVIVIDKLDHQVSLTLHNKLAAATTPASGVAP